MESTPNIELEQCSNSSKATCCVINVGSRKSQLALIQTNSVISRLKEFYSNNPDRILHKPGCSQMRDLDFKVVSMTTTGDQVLDKPLPQIGTKSLFTRELEIELLEKRVHFVVHSLKDLPTSLPEGCIIGAILKRDSPDDTIVLKRSLRSKMKPLDLLLNRKLQPDGKAFKVGTSSQRRIAMIKRCNSNIECIDIRGNLNTRLSKLDNDDSEYSAIVLAKAGLDRMGWSDRASSLLSPDTSIRLNDWCYAVGQGAIAVECRRNDDFVLDLLSPLVDIKTSYEVIAERSLMKRLEGGCSVPLGVRSVWTQEDVLELDGIVVSLDGKEVVKAKGHLTPTSWTGGESDHDGMHSKMTGITFSRSAFPSHIRKDMINCSNLGIQVANKMIDLGCLELMVRGK